MLKLKQVQIGTKPNRILLRIENEADGKMRIIGITGGIGSGKSTVSGILGEIGAKIIDADVIARDIVNKDGEVLKELVQCFGQGILDENGQLNRKGLGNLVFGNSRKLKDLNTITHKYIINRMIEIVHVEAEKSNAAFLVIEAAVPVVHGFIDLVDETWVVISDVNSRVERVMKRNSLNHREIMDRIESQMSDEGYIEIADKVLYNNKSIDELRKEIKQLIHFNQ